MPKKRVHEIAKERGMSSKALLAKLQEAGLDVNAAASAVDEQAVIRVASGSTVKDVAEYFGVPVPEVIKKLMTLGEMATLTKTLSDEAIGVLAEEFNKTVEVTHAADEVVEDPTFDDAEEDLVE